MSRTGKRLTPLLPDSLPDSFILDIVQSKIDNQKARDPAAESKLGRGEGAGKAHYLIVFDLLRLNFEPSSKS